jgi:hypothetical protein
MLIRGVRKAALMGELADLQALLIYQLTLLFSLTAWQGCGLLLRMWSFPA